MAREAIESVSGIQTLLMSGTRATFTLEQGRYFDAKAVTKAIAEKGLELLGFRMEVRSRAAAAWRIESTGLG